MIPKERPSITTTSYNTSSIILTLLTMSYIHIITTYAYYAENINMILIDHL